MVKTEVQEHILKSTESLFRLCSAISKLPESGTRGELIYNHDKILQRLNALHSELQEIDATCCYYGFTDKCPGCCCVDCDHCYL